MTCDRHLSARAQYVIWTRSGGVLYFCGHCYRKHEPAFVARGYRTANLEDSKADAGQRIGW